MSCSSDPKEYALKQIEGSGLSMSACREIAVRIDACSEGSDDFIYCRRSDVPAPARTEAPERDQSPEGFPLAC